MTDDRDVHLFSWRRPGFESKRNASPLGAAASGIGGKKSRAARWQTARRFLELIKGLACLPKVESVREDHQ
jgi:hypothetical protein